MEKLKKKKYEIFNLDKLVEVLDYRTLEHKKLRKSEKSKVKKLRKK